MALIRGINRLCSCLVCLVNKERQSDLTCQHLSRQIDDAKSIMEQDLSFTARNNALKPIGIRPVEVKQNLS